MELARHVRRPAKRLARGVPISGLLCLDFFMQDLFGPYGKIGWPLKKSDCRIVFLCNYTAKLRLKRSRPRAGALGAAHVEAR